MRARGQEEPQKEMEEEAATSASVTASRRVTKSHFHLPNQATEKNVVRILVENIPLLASESCF